MDENYNDYIEELLKSEVEIKRKTKDNVSFLEVVDLFVGSIVNDIMNEYEETPKFNIIFSDEAIDWLRQLLKTPFMKEGYLICEMGEDDINNLSFDKQNDCESPTIIVENHILFFELLTDIINQQVSLYYDYGRSISARSVAVMLLRKVWLRMNADDFSDVLLFLTKQLEFLKNREFDEPSKEKYLKDYDKFKITYEVEKCEIWCESTRRMYFKIYDGVEYHDLPKVYYDICLENGEMVCYISAVQMPIHKKRIKSIEREVYKLNKNVSGSSLVHPNFMMSLSLFFEILRSHKIVHVKVPILQILSYRYHEILSEIEKENFEKEWNQEKIDYLNSLKNSGLFIDKARYERFLKKYEVDKINYDRFVFKEDFISKTKIDGLINLFMQMMYIDNDVIVNTEPYINASYLDILINKNRKINKSK